MKIAVTTSDGLKVNQHFGKADVFHVYDFEGGVLKLLEKREVDSYCRSKDEGPIEHEFEVDRFSMVYSTINDCSVLYTQQIGSKPEYELKKKGMHVQICNCKIASIISCGGKCKE